jgi:hypothetical protein
MSVARVQLCRLARHRFSAALERVKYWREFGDGHVGSLCI